MQSEKGSWTWRSSIASQTGWSFECCQRNSGARHKPLKNVVVLVEMRKRKYNNQRRKGQGQDCAVKWDVVIVASLS